MLCYKLRTIPYSAESFLLVNVKYPIPNTLNALYFFVAVNDLGVMAVDGPMGEYDYALLGNVIICNQTKLSIL